MLADITHCGCGKGACYLTDSGYACNKYLRCLTYDELSAKFIEAQQGFARLKEQLHEITFFQSRADARVHPQYETGWNDAVFAITEKARAYFAGQGSDADTFVDENIHLRKLCADVLADYGYSLPDEIKDRLRAALSQA